jgi:hypothetical protein
LAGWLAGWLAGNAEISELARDRDFRFAAVDSVGHGGWTIQKILDQAPLCARDLLGPNIFMSVFNNMGVDLG